MAPSWLTTRPVAHRGLHDRATGLVENTLPAVEAAIHHDFAVEVDLQLAGDGEVMVFHDYTLDRLTHDTGSLIERNLVELEHVLFKEGHAHIPTLGELLYFVAGRVPLFLEVKSRFDGAPRTLARAADHLAGYEGPVALMSFDPAAVAAGHDLFPDRPIGIVAEVFGDHEEWAPLSALDKYQYANLNHAYATRPDFIAYNVRHLPSVACETLRRQYGVPLLTWTVRDEAQRLIATKHADQMIFEGFVA